MNSNEDLPAISYDGLLQKIGIEPESLTYRHAEKMPLDMLESTFVEHPHFDEFITFEDSAVLLADQGGGKTTNRRWLELKLKKEQQEAIKNSSSGKNVPFVVVYTDFEMIVHRLPNIDLLDHRRPLMQAVARAFIEFIDEHPNKFLQLGKRNRDWWWAFINYYLKHIVHDLQNEVLIADWQGSHEEINLFTDIGLIESLNNVQQRLFQLGFNRFYLLIDGIDGYTETTSFSNLEKLVGQLVDAHDFCSYQGRVVKFFLSTNLEATIKESSCYLSGRLRVIHIQWVDKNNKYDNPPKRVESLVEFLELRLGWSRNEKKRYEICNLHKLCTNDLSIELESELREGDNDSGIKKNFTIEKKLVLLSLEHKFLGAPRALLDFVNRLLKIALTQDKLTISLADWIRFEASVQPYLKPKDSVTSVLPSITRRQQMRLIDLLCVPATTSTYEGRSGLLQGIPGIANLERDQGIQRLDLELIVGQLIQLGQMATNEWPLLILIENAKPYVKGFMHETEFDVLMQELEQAYKEASR